MNNYTIDMLERDIARIVLEGAAVRRDKGARYGTKKDTLANIRDAGGWRIAYGSAFECLCRLRNYVRVPDDRINDKDFDNASEDLINFVLYIKVLRMQERENA